VLIDAHVYSGDREASRVGYGCRGYPNHSGNLFIIPSVMFDASVNTHAMNVGYVCAWGLGEQWIIWGDSPVNPELNERQQGLFQEKERTNER
jgi:hypothetical protein